MLRKFGAIRYLQYLQYLQPLNLLQSQSYSNTVVLMTLQVILEALVLCGVLVCNSHLPIPKHDLWERGVSSDQGGTKYRIYTVLYRRYFVKGILNKIPIQLVFLYTVITNRKSVTILWVQVVYLICPPEGRGWTYRQTTSAYITTIV